MWLIGGGHLSWAESLVSLPGTGIRDFRALINFCWSFELKTSSLWSCVVAAFYKLLIDAEKSGLGREQNAGAPRKAEKSGHMASVSVRLRPGFLMTPIPSSSPSVTCSISVHGYSRILQDPCSTSPFLLQLAGLYHHNQQTLGSLGRCEEMGHIQDGG